MSHGMNNKGANQTAWMCKLVCAFSIFMQQSQVFLLPGPNKSLSMSVRHHYDIILVALIAVGLLLCYHHMDLDMSRSVFGGTWQINPLAYLPRYR